MKKPTVELVKRLADALEMATSKGDMMHDWQYKEISAVMKEANEVIEYDPDPMNWVGDPGME